ncbi:MAG: hypothetical protein WCJ61_14300, partial [Paludibacter sp.]
LGLTNLNVTKMCSSFTITTSTEKGRQKDFDASHFGTSHNYLSYSTSQTKKIKTENDSSIIELKSNVKLKYIDDTSIGLTRFLPFYKPVQVHSKIHYQWTAEVWINNRKSLLANQNILNLNGEANITGFCSARHASKLIKKDVKAQIEKEIRKDIDNQISNLK